MNYVVSILPVAELEAAEAALYYEEQKANLGADFLDELDTAREHLSDQPSTLFLYFYQQNIAQYCVKTISLSIDFRIEGNQVIVISVHHEKQKPFK